MEVQAEDDRIAILTSQSHYDLKTLLLSVKPGELQDAFDWGADIGREVTEWGVQPCPRL